MIEARIQNLGIILPLPTAPTAHYISYTVVDTLVFISGQLPMQNGIIQYTGPVHANNIEEAKKAAQLCAVNLLAQLKSACENDWRRLKTCVRLGGFIHCANDFTQHSQVMNGASELLTEILGKAGHHVRTSIGSSSLPQNAMVEIDAIFQLH